MRYFEVTLAFCETLMSKQMEYMEQDRYSEGLWSPNLPGVKKDVALVAEALKEHGFQVKLVENPADRDQLDEIFTDFIDRYAQKTNDRLLFYFSGHGHTLKNSLRMTLYIWMALS